VVTYHVVHGIRIVCILWCIEGGVRVQNPLSWDYLTDVPARDRIFGPLSIVFLAIFVLGLLATVVVNNRVRNIFPTHRLHRETLHKITYRAMWAWVVGLIFFGCRVLGLNLLGWRLWEYVSLLGMIAFVGYALYWLRVKYPPVVAKFQKEQRRRAYLRPGSAAALALTSSKSGAAASRADRQSRLDRADPTNRPAQRRPQNVPKASAKK